MRKVCICFFLLLCTLLTLSCGSSGRHLQSISITQSVSGQQIQFVASGTYSAAPTTVSPLPVDWILGLPAPPPTRWTYTLSNQPYAYDCSNLNPLRPGSVTAVAPTDPNAPASGTTTNVVMASLPFSCQ